MMIEKHLERTRLGDVTTHISSGSTPKGGETVYLKDGPVMLVRSQNVRMNALDLSDVAYISDEMDAGMKRSVVRENDVLLNITGASIGRAARFCLDKSVRANVNQHVCIIRPDQERLDSKFLTYFLCSSEVQHDINNRHQHGGTRQALTFPQIANFEIPLPALPEQRRIADILDKADAIRLKRRAMIDGLNELRGSQFDEWFAPWFRSGRTDGLVSVSEFVARFEGGLNMASPESATTETKHYVLKVSAATWGEYRPDECKPIPTEYTPPPEHFVRTGDLLFSRANTTELIGATAYVYETPPDRVLPDKLWRFVWKNPADAQPLFVWALFNHPRVRQEIGRRSSGTSGSMKNISMDKVMSMRVPWPDLPMRRKFADLLLADRKIRQRLLCAANEADNFFGMLVQRAFRGEL